MNLNLSRRQFLGTGAASAALLTQAAGLFAASPVMAAAQGPHKVRTVRQMLAMSPVEMARESTVVEVAQEMLNVSARRLTDKNLSRLILDVMKNPAPTIAAQDDKALLAKLRAAGLIDEERTSVMPPCKSTTQAPQPYWSAPGSGYASHHAYPGGLVTHCAMNVVSAEKLCESYDDVFGLTLDANAAVGGELLHDLHKPWVFQWQADNSSRKEEILARTGEHHVLSIAESMKRGVPVNVCVAQACAHDHPGTEKSEALVVGWIKAAAIIAGIDPVAKGFLAADGKTLPLPRRIEGFAVHLADHDFVISGPACQWTVKAMKRLAKENYGITADKDFNAMRNYVFANLTAMRLYGILSTKGERALGDEITRVLKA